MSNYTNTPTHTHTCTQFTGRLIFFFFKVKPISKLKYGRDHTGPIFPRLRLRNRLALWKSTSLANTHCCSESEGFPANRVFALLKCFDVRNPSTLQKKRLRLSIFTYRCGLHESFLK